MPKLLALESMSTDDQTKRVAPPVSPRPHATGPPGEPPPAARTQQRMARIGTVLALQARALSHSRFQGAGTAITTELCSMLECDRVSIGFIRKGRIAIAAISNTGDFRERQSLVRLIGAAMEEALDQRTTIVHPTPQGSSPKVTLAHAHLSESSARAAICTVPIADRDHLLGAVLLEGRKGFTAEAVRLAQGIALFVGPVLALKHRVDDSFARRWEDLLARSAVSDCTRSHHRPASLFFSRCWHWRLARQCGRPPFASPHRRGSRVRSSVSSRRPWTDSSAK